MKLYKFISLPANEDIKSPQFEKFIDSILKSKVYFSSMPWLNDPFDGTIILNNLSNDECQQVYDAKKELLEDFDTSIIEPYVQNAPYNMSITNRILSTSFSQETIFNRITLHDANRKPISIRYSDLMWAYYANGHHGACLEYDFNETEDIAKLLVKDADGILKMVRISDPSNITPYRGNIVFKAAPIQYLSEPEPIEFSKGKCSKDYEFMPLFLNKSNTWIFEQEYRIIAQAPNHCAFSLRDKSYFVQCKQSCLKSIRLGFKMSTPVKKEILDTLRSKNIAIYDTHLGTDFTLHYQTI